MSEATGNDNVLAMCHNLGKSARANGIPANATKDEVFVLYLNETAPATNAELRMQCIDAWRAGWMGGGEQ